MTSLIVQLLHVSGLEVREYLIIDEGIIFQGACFQAEYPTNAERCWYNSDGKYVKRYLILVYAWKTDTRNLLIPAVRDISLYISEELYEPRPSITHVPHAQVDLQTAVHTPQDNA